MPLPVSAFEPRDPDFGRRVRQDFAKQAAMTLLGARLTRVDPGVVEIEMPYRADLTQQHGFFHAGLLTTIADSAGGYAAFTLMDADAEVLSVELKANFLAPAAGTLARARGTVLRPGRTLTVCEFRVDVDTGTSWKSCVTGLQTLVARRAAPDGRLQ